MEYFVNFIDHFSHFGVIYLMKNKSETMEKFREYVNMVEAQFGIRIQNLRCDNEGEYTSTEFKRFVDRKKSSYNIP